MWRNSGQTRYFISAICNWIFIVLFHLHTTTHLSRSIYIIKNAAAIDYAFEVGLNPEEYEGSLSEDAIAMQVAYMKQWEPELIAFEQSGM